MLKKINAGGIEGKDFKIQITGPERMSYSSQLINIDLELTYDQSEKIVYIYISNIKELSETDKEKIKNDLYKAVNLLDDKFKIL